MILKNKIFFWIYHKKLINLKGVYLRLKMMFKMLLQRSSKGCQKLLILQDQKVFIHRIKIKVHSFILLDINSEITMITMNFLHNMNQWKIRLFILINRNNLHGILFLIRVIQKLGIQIFVSKIMEQILVFKLIRNLKNIISINKNMLFLIM